MDALRLIKEIPGSTTDEAMSQITVWIKDLSKTDRNRLLELCRAYKLYVRTQFGAILEYLYLPVEDLLETPNPVTRYKLGISSTILPTIKNWNIV